MAHLPNKSKKLKNASSSSLSLRESQKSVKAKFHDPEKIQEILKKPGPITDEELTILMEDSEMKKQMLIKSVNELKQLEVSSPLGLRLFCSDPNNFTPEEWANLQEQRKVLNSPDLPVELKEAFGQFLDGNISIDTGNTFTKGSPSELNLPQERRTKAGGRAQRRGWLPMR